MLEQEFISIMPADYAWLCIVLASMLPLFEIHGAIPFGLSNAVWGENALPLWQVCIFSFLGASLMAIIVLSVLFLFLKLVSKNKRFTKFYAKFKSWLDTKFFKYDVTKQNTKSLKFKKWWLLMLFNAVPLPFSGVWTSGLLAMFLNISFPLALSALLVGNLITTLFMALLCGVFFEFVDLVLIIFVIVTLLFVVYQLLKLLLNKFARNKPSSSL